MASARKLEQDINTMTDTFYNLIRAAYVTEEKDEGVKQDRKVSGELMEVLAERLVLAGQSVLTLIAELKRQALLSDFAALNKMIDEKDAANKGLITHYEARLVAARSQMLQHQTSLAAPSEEQDAELRRLYLLAQEVPLHQ